MKSYRWQSLVSGLGILVFFVLASTCLGQEFTATTIGDFGNVSVIGISGNYDAKKTDGSINESPRQTIAKEFLRTHKDEYDFLCIFSNFDFEMPEPNAKAFYLGVRNDVKGIGLPIFDYSGEFGSNGKLQGTIDMGNVAYLTTDPVDPGFEVPLNVISHELMHRWGAHVRFKEAGGTASGALLGKDASHWSFLLDSDASVLYGNAWQRNPDGTFTSVGAMKHLSPLDLYLMGFYDKTRVRPMTLIENPAVDATRMPEPGATISGSPRSILIDDIIAAEGERTPAAADSQKTFKMGFILITNPGMFTGYELYGIENVREAWIARFSVLTDGEGIAEVVLTSRDSIPENPGPPTPHFDPRTIPANIEDGVKWLMNNQRPDGSWMDLPQTLEKDTAEALLALKNFEAASQNYSTGLQWLTGISPGNIDYLARKVEVLASSGRDASALVSELVLHQNPDGGWGGNGSYLSSALDTSLVLRALSIAKYWGGGTVAKAISYLKAKQNGDGGWGSDDGEGTVQATANVLSVFHRYENDYSLADAIARGTAWLLGRQNSDGGFGNSPSTVYDTALAVTTLREIGASTSEATGDGLNYLLRLQSADGSWYESPYQTALAVGAVYKATIDPDLSIQTGDITFTPTSVSVVPSAVTVDVVVWNLGRTPVPEAKVVLYDGALSPDRVVGEKSVSIPGQSPVKVTFPATISDGDEHWFYVSLDPEHLVSESNRSNNTALKILYPATSYDFEILPGDLSVSANPVDIFQDVTITAKVTNRGTSNAFNVQIRYTIDDPVSPLDLGTLTVDIPAGTTLTKQLTWRASRAGDNMPIVVYADPFDLYAEMSENNNKAATSLTVNGSTNPNLTLSYEDIEITPTPASEQGTARISALVKNHGFSSASDVEVSFYMGVPGTDGLLLGTLTIPSLAVSESSRVSFDWTNIQTSGERIIYVAVDPNGRIGEIREDDNDAFVTLKILTLPDLAISGNSIFFNPAAPREGDIVSIRLTVQNQGEQAASHVMVKAIEGSTLIGSQEIASVPGLSQGTVLFTYDTGGKQGTHRITASVDPDNLIPELSEDNNQASRMLGVQNSDFWLTEPYISPDGDGVKDSTDFFFRLSAPRTVNVVVSNDRGKPVRTFGGPEFENTTAGNITWDGLNDKGLLVNDGVYQINLLDTTENLLGGLPVVVDTNRSPLTDAIGTNKLLKNNITCVLPDFRKYFSSINAWGWDMAWFPDENGIVLNISTADAGTPWYPPGLYTMAPDGEDVVRITPAEWNAGVDPGYDYSISKYGPSPDGKRIAILIRKTKKNSYYGDYIYQLWVVDRDGKNLKNLTLDLEPDKENLYDFKWSPTGEFIVLPGTTPSYTFGGQKLWIVRADGSDIRPIFLYGYCPYWGDATCRDVFLDFSHLAWSRDGTRFALAELIPPYNMVRPVSSKALVFAVDTAASSAGGYEINASQFSVLEWFTNGELLVYTGHSLYGLSGDQTLYPVYTFSTSPDGKRIAYIGRDSDQWYVNILDDKWQSTRLYESPAVSPDLYSSSFQDLVDLRWSNDGTKLALVDRTFKQRTTCDYEGHLVVVAPETKEVTDVKVSDSEYRCSDTPVPEIVPEIVPEGEIFVEAQPVYSEYVPGSLQWLSDDAALLGRNAMDGYFLFNSIKEQKISLSLDGNFVGFSPLKRFITYEKSVDPASVCYGHGSIDLWAGSSLLNLTANLKITKEKSAVVLKGIAADLNFEGYLLEYADARTPAVWNPIAPASGVPVFDDTFTTWVPPYEGIFYVRLTVWDKAGNAAWDRKRVSWGLSASITNLYKSTDIISPNGDGVKDSVDLHYRALEPVHLEFYVFDLKGQKVRMFVKDNPVAADDLITWDGKDANGSVVPDGKYKIKVFDYEFFVEVDATPPDVMIALTSIVYKPPIEETVMGHATDKNIQTWIIEYGEGDNPDQWLEYDKGSEPLGNLDGAITGLGEDEIGWLVGKKLKITAEDFAGNRSTEVTDFLEEIVVITDWDGTDTRFGRDKVGKFLPGQIPADLALPGAHTVGVLSTIRLPIVSLNVQYWDGMQWTDSPSAPDPSSGRFIVEWDNSFMNPEEGYAFRVRAIDILGEEHYSNELYAQELFGFVPAPGCGLAAQNSLFENLTWLKFQAAKRVEGADPQWSDYRTMDKGGGDVIPRGQFPLPLPSDPPGISYLIRMLGMGESGVLYETRTYYPPVCLGFALQIAYPPAECGLVSGKATLSSWIEGFNSIFSLRSLSYTIQKAGGLELLHQFDLTRERELSLQLDTLGLPEGSYPVTATLSYLDLGAGKVRERSASNVLVVDRVLPTSRITYPAESMTLCPLGRPDPGGQWIGIPVEGIATDNANLKEYDLSFGIGEYPSEWRSAKTRSGNGSIPISGNKPLQGTVGFWDVTDLRGADFSLRLKVTDEAGNVSCSTTRFSVDTLIDIPELISDKILFSPNGDDNLDDINVHYVINEYATVDVKAFKLVAKPDLSYDLDSQPVRTITAGLRHLSGEEETSWDGKDDFNAAVPDGLYGIAVFAKDACGNTNMTWTEVEIDNAAPQAVISYPAPFDPLGIIVEVRGTAQDAHFQFYTLEVGEGDRPETWLSLASGTSPVGNKVLGQWNTFGREGRWTLRLRALDNAFNQSETTVTVDLGTRKELIKDLRALPSLFSPNGDGKLDTATVSYELTEACDIEAEFKDDQGRVVKTHRTSHPSVGAYTYAWDGRNDGGEALPDGIYVLKLTAALSSNPSVKQSESIILAVDATPPVLDIRLPAKDSYTAGSLVVSGSITDENLLEYLLQYTGGEGAVLLDKGGQARVDYPFGILRDLPEGNYILHAEAKDLGESLTKKDVAFGVDRTSPQVSLSRPREGDSFGADKATVLISGAIVERNLDRYQVRFGAGDNPSQWTELVSGNALPAAPELFKWNVGKTDGVPDGLYTVSLYAEDKAGLKGEAKAKVTVDNTAPEASISSPKDGDYVKAGIQIIGTASDSNLDHLTLEIGKGRCLAASGFVSLNTDTKSIRDGLIGRWLALPEDGDYCLRLTAVDKVGNKAEAKVSVAVDMTPPTAPVLSAQVENKKDVILTWTGNTEPDLDGYHVYRDNQRITAERVRVAQFTDHNEGEGVFVYTVTAFDRAGNESKPSNAASVTLDRTPPNARISVPHDGSRVSGQVNIKGTAYSGDDFKQYRVSVGVGPAPTSWSLVRTSPVPVSYGSLTQWDALGLAEGTYTIRLEAEDLSGNLGAHEVAVTVDNTPPAPPVLVSAAPNGSDVALTWQANHEADLSGYLLYRNDQLANVSGIVIGDLTPYLVTGTSYTDRALPDGRLKYYLIAMDSAGNQSDPSNSLEATVDTHPPHATISDPKDGAKFEEKTFVRAESADTDIASVQFQYKRAQDPVWKNLGGPVLSAPFVSYLDPVGLALAYGDHHLRAIATDAGGKTDPSPSSITLTYTDVTPPEPPQDLRAATPAGKVELTWKAPAATDLDGYNVYRTVGTYKTRVNSSLVKMLNYEDASSGSGTLTYTVTAVDTHGNESLPSNAAQIRIYSASLDQPYTPAGERIISITGKSVPAGSSVELFFEASPGPIPAGSSIANADGQFACSQVNLNPGENRIFARAKEASGNVSKNSNTVKVVYNEAPSQPTGLASAVQGHQVSLSWTPNPEPDLAGYHLYRDGKRLNNNTSFAPASAYASSEASGHSASMAFDSNPATYWMPNNSSGVFNPVILILFLPARELVSSLDIHWGVEGPPGDETLYAGRSFSVQVWSGDAWITHTLVAENAAKDSRFEFKPPYRTDRIEISISGTTDSATRQVRISEIELMKENPVSAASYDDSVLKDGTYQYKVTAVDSYGFESVPSDELSVAVGDVVPPSPPLNLVAEVSGANINLQWSAPSSGSDLSGYNVYKNTSGEWGRINEGLLDDRFYADANVLNGTHTYRVTAVDATGNESLPSNEASARVEAPLPVSPLNLRVTSVAGGRALDAEWEYTGSPVKGYTLYRSTTPGGPYVKATPSSIAAQGYRDQGLANGTIYFYVAASVDFAGNESGFSNEASGIPLDEVSPDKPTIYYPTSSENPIVIYKDTVDLAGSAEPGTTVELFRNGISVGSVKALEIDEAEDIPLGGYDSASLSPDGKMAAYSSTGTLWLKSLDTGEDVQVDRSGSSPVWSPDGKKIAYSYGSSTSRISIYDVEKGWSMNLTYDSYVGESNPSWSSDAGKIAFLSYRTGKKGIWIKDMLSGALSSVSADGNESNPTISPDGKRLGYFEDTNLYVANLSDGTRSSIDSQADPSSLDWSPDSKKLAFVSFKNGNGDVYIFDVTTSQLTQMTYSSTDESSPVWSPDGGSLVFRRDSSLWVVSFSTSDPERSLDENASSAGSLSWTRSGAIAYDTETGLRIVHPQGYFGVTDVALNAGENNFEAAAADASGNASPRSDAVTIFFDGGVMPDLEVSQEDISIFPGVAIEGEEVQLQVTVRNSGPIDIKGVGVDIYFWDATGRFELLKSEIIDSIWAGYTATLPLSWNTAGKAGTNSVIVVVDPADAIQEFIETNNSATKEFLVAKKEELSMITTLFSDRVGGDTDLAISVGLANSGVGKNVSLEVRVEDEDGGKASSFAPLQISLPYGSSKSYDLTWNTGSTFAGNYRVHSLLREGTAIVIENLVPFDIAPDVKIDAALVTDKAVYGPDENALVSLEVRNEGLNYIVPKIEARVRIADRAGKEVFAEDKEIRNLFPGATAGLESIWNTGLSLPADYSAFVSLYLNGEKLSERSAPFRIGASVIVTGRIGAAPSLVDQGKTVLTDYTIRNSGNIDMAGVTVKVMVLDPVSLAIVDSREENINLTTSGTRTGQVTFSTEGYALKTYAVLLAYLFEGKEETLSSTSITVKDGTPPALTLLSPSPGSRFNSPFEISALAADSGSGIDKVEYAVDGGPWKLLPLADAPLGRYSTKWDQMAVEGTHSFSLRALDRSGNRTEPASTAFMIDLAPIITFSPPGDLTSNVPVTVTYSVTDTLDPDPIVTSTFPSPTTLSRNGVYTITVEAVDHSGNEAVKSITITLVGISQPPAIHLTSPIGGEIWSGTHDVRWEAADPDGDLLAIGVEYSPDGGATWVALTTGERNDGVYTWNTTSVANGTNYVIRVSADDGKLQATDQSSPFTLHNDFPPVAEAGPDQNVITRNPVTLNGSKSYDPENGLITFRWTVTEVPAGSSITGASLSDPASPKPVFTPDVDGTYVFNLTVSDGELNGEDEVTIFANTPNVAPNAEAGPDQNIFTSAAALLDGTRSNDPDNGPLPLSYGWSFVALPPESALKDTDIVGRDQSLASFIPDLSGLYVVKLTVSDGDLLAEDTVRLTAATPNVPPNANAGQDITVWLGEEAVLDGSASQDPDNGPQLVTYRWDFVSLPKGSQLSRGNISGADTVSPSFAPDVEGTYVLALMVSDGAEQAFDNVAVTAEKRAGFDLGKAGPGYWALLALGGMGSGEGTDVSMTGFSSIRGSVNHVGVAEKGDFKMSGSSRVTGSVFLNSAGSLKQSGNSGIDGTIHRDAASDNLLRQAVADANAASLSASNMKATLLMDKINITHPSGSVTLIGAAGVNVLQLKELTISNGTLTLSGPGGSSFIVNVSGKFKLTGGSDIVVADGVRPLDVLINVTGKGEKIELSGGSSKGVPKTTIQGILLAPQREVSIGPGMVVGEVISGGKHIELSSYGEIYNPGP